MRYFCRLVGLEIEMRRYIANRREQTRYLLRLRLGGRPNPCCAVRAPPPGARLLCGDVGGFSSFPEMCK